MRKIQSKFSALVSDISDKAAIAGQTFTGDIAAPVVKSLEYDFSDQQFFTDSYIAGSKTGNAIAADQGGFAIRTQYYNGSNFVDIPNGQARSNAAWRVYWSTNKTIQFGSRAGNPVSSLISDNDGNIGIGTTTPAEKLSVNGTVAPTTDNSRTLGTASLRWSEVFAGTGTINTSDAREKTDVRQFNASEITAAKTISKEIGVYRWLQSVAEKGDGARLHVGFTVQRAMEIMIANDLDPMAYGFICYDEWNDIFVEHAEVLAVKAVEESEGSEAVEAVEAREAWTEKTREAGDRYAFRYDQLNLFIARGIEARLSDLEDNA
jgi:hypothetical protein